MKRLLILLILLISVQATSFSQTVRNSWNFGFGFSYPRFYSSDVRPEESNYGGFISLQRYFSESVSLRLKGSYLSIEGRIPGGIYFYTDGTLVPSMQEYMRSNILSGNVSILYNFAPCSPVSPYFGFGIGAASFDPDWPENIVNPEAELKTSAELNLILGSEWRLSSNWEMITELGYNSLDSQVDGIINNNRQGILGSNADGYISFNLGFQYYFSKGAPSEYCKLYDGVKTGNPEKDYPTLEEIEGVVKRYSTEPAEIDYNRIEEIIKKYHTSYDQKWVLCGVNFETGKSTLTRESYPVLEHTLEILRENKGLRVEVQGHTDNTGSETFNQVLSKQRADRVKDFLVNKGIEPGRLISIGYGESKPIADNNNETGKAKNRRVEFKILK